MKTLLRYCFAFISILAFENVSANNITSPKAGTDATLKSIVLSTATSLFYATGPADYNYTTSVSPGTSSISIDPTTNDPAATVTVNGVNVPSGTQSGPLTLNGIVTTTINMVVTASDGVTTHTYAIVVYETGSNNAFLSGLTLGTGNTLVPSNTGTGTYNYTTSVNPATTSLPVTATVADPTATITYNVGGGASTTATSGIATNPIALNSTGTTTINVVVLAQDGTTTQTYSVVVSKTGSNDATLSALSVSTGTNLVLTSTGPSNINYVTAVASTVASLKVTPTTNDPNATVTVNGVAVARGNSSGSITLNFPETIILQVTAQDGTTIKTYSITVNNGALNNASLKSNPVLSTGNSLTQTSTSGTGTNNAFVYFATSVSPGTASLTVTSTAADPNATITVNGVVVASGVASGPIALNTVAGAITPITIVVKSADATKTVTNTINVSENGSNNANITGINLSTNSSLISAGITVNPNGITINYNTSVSKGTPSMTITTTLADPTATITVGGNSVANATPSGSITLTQFPGTTLIPIVVTAEDRVTQNTFNITVSQNGSKNASITSIALTPASALISSTTGPASPPSGLGSAFNFTTSVSSTLTTLTLKTTPADLNASVTSVTVNGAVVYTNTVSGIYTAVISLNSTGTTPIVISVTSEDGSTVNNYGITVSKLGSNNASITGGIILSTGSSLTGVSNPPPNTLNYTATVSPRTITITASTILSDPNATMTINGLAVASSVPSAPIALANTGTTTIQIAVTAQDGITQKYYNVTISKTGSIIAWTGTGANQDWATPTNWNPAKVPGAGDVATFNVPISSTVTGAYTNQPVISAASTTVGEIDFGPTNPTVLTVNQSAKLVVSTNLSVYNGATATIQGSGSSTSFVDISSGAFVTDTGKLIISTPVKLTLKSDPSGSASIGQLSSTSSIVGNVTVERYITGGSSVYRGYRLLSSPVYQGTANGNNVYSLNYVQGTVAATVVGGVPVLGNGALVTGPAGGGFNSVGVGNPSLFLYREDQAPSNSSFTSGNYWGISAINNTPVYNYYLNGGTTIYNIPVGNGFDFFYRGDISNPAAKYVVGTVAEAVVMTTTGTLNQGPITVHNWYTPTSANVGFTNTPGNSSVRGFNLVGNPYASNIDW
ncbi:MAG TPA: cadherin-like beta sandwich domain-containing protein, partial [Mucilaginibacter sp.]